jgi:hypothetical protein
MIYEETVVGNFKELPWHIQEIKEATKCHSEEMLSQPRLGPQTYQKKLESYHSITFDCRT